VSEITKGLPQSHTIYYLPSNSSDSDYPPLCTSSGRLV